MIWLEIRNLRLVVLVILMLFKKSIQNKPEYEFAPTLSFEPVTFVQHEDKQSTNNELSIVNTSNDNKIRTEDIFSILDLANGHRRVNRQATIHGQFGHAQVPTSYSQNGFNSASAKYPGDQLLSYPSYSNSNPSLQYPQNNIPLGQPSYYSNSPRPGFSQYPNNFQPGQTPNYTSNPGSINHYSPNYTRPGYVQPSAPIAVTPGYNQYQHNTNQPGQLPQYHANQRPGYPFNQYSSNSQFGQTQQNQGIVTPGYQQYPRYNQSGHTSQYPTNQLPGYNQYPSNTFPNTNFNNYQAGYTQQYPVPMRPGDSPSLMYSTTQQPGYHQYPNNLNRYG